MKWRKTSRYSHQSDDGYTVAKFHIDGTDILGVTPPDARKPALFGSRAAVLEWIEKHRRSGNGVHRRAFGATAGSKG